MATNDKISVDGYSIKAATGQAINLLAQTEPEIVKKLSSELKLSDTERKEILTKVSNLVLRLIIIQHFVQNVAVKKWYDEGIIN